jgi:NADH-quinone oxidoreductase subunit B
LFNNYAIVQGCDHIIPVDIYVPGCPPRPDMLIDAIFKLRKQEVQWDPIGKNIAKQASQHEEKTMAGSLSALGGPRP